MSRRILISSFAAVVVGGIAVGGFAMASFTFTTDVRDASGVKGLKVIAWPASSKLDPTEAELRSVDSAECRSTSDETSRCTYTLKITEKEESGRDRGTWHISAPATAEDGDTGFVSRAASFEITG
ncbi:DUF5707 domain-containing protein [Streptomyces sp. NPDC020707]|uniref:DUF5707 domain-containing protein n=1 Tax=Streptomyces sp. NPDC020707 TaxID=3365084 RepID=UPI00379E9625